MAFDGKGSIAIMTGKKLDLSQLYLAFAWTYVIETWIFDHFVTYFQQIWRRWQKFPPRKVILCKSYLLSALVSIKKLISQFFISFQKISIVFWIYHLAIINKPGFSGICSVCNDPNFSTGQREKQINQGHYGKKRWIENVNQL